MYEYLVIQSCLTLCNPLNLAHQALLSMRFSRQEYWSRLPFASSRGSSPLRDRTRISCVSCTAGGFFTGWIMEEVLLTNRVITKKKKKFRECMERDPWTEVSREGESVLNRRRSLSWHWWGRIKTQLYTKLESIEDVCIRNWASHLRCTGKKTPFCVSEFANCPHGQNALQVTKKKYCHTAVFDNKQGPTVQHRELSSILCNNLNGEVIRKRRETCICVTESLRCTPEANTMLLISYAPIKIKI